MADRTIPELKGKLRGLMLSEIAQKVGKFSGNPNSFGVATTIGRPAMRSLLETKKASSISEAHERKIADCCQFAIDWETWQIGKTSDFIAHYERVHREAVQSRLSNILLARGTDIEPEPSPIKDLLSIQAFTAQYGRGIVQLGFELSCGKLRATHGLLVSIRSGLLELCCFPASIQRSSRKGFDKSWEWSGSQGIVSFEWNVGSTFTGRWRLTAEGPSIGNLDVPPEFVTVEKLAPGDEIEIRFGFRVKDFGLSEESDAIQFDDGTATRDDLVIEPSAQPLTAIDPQKLSIAKKKILARLATEALIDDGGGVVVHARHRVGFVAHPSSSEEESGQQ